jgi:hypothetical protein
MESRFSESSPVKVSLLHGALYSDDPVLWKALLDHQAAISDYFHEIGLALVVDPQEGYAYLEQMDVEQDDGMPRLFRRRYLGFEFTMLLVILREELLRFDATPRAAASIPTVEEDWLVEQMGSFIVEMNNQVKRRGVVDQAIALAVRLGVLRRVQTVGDSRTYQIMRIVKAKLPEEKITEVRARLRAGQSVREDESNGDQSND